MKTLGKSSKKKTFFQKIDEYCEEEDVYQREVANTIEKRLEPGHEVFGEECNHGRPSLMGMTIFNEPQTDGGGSAGDNKERGSSGDKGGSPDRKNTNQRPSTPLIGFFREDNLIFE